MSCSAAPRKTSPPASPIVTGPSAGLIPNEVTIFDNHNLGGFAGGEPVGKAENFRCAYAEGLPGQTDGTSLPAPEGPPAKEGAGIASRPLLSSG